MLDKLDRIEELLLKHQPGRHDQQRHAGTRGGGGANTDSFANWSGQVTSELKDKGWERISSHEKSETVSGFSGSAKLTTYMDGSTFASVGNKVRTYDTIPSVDTIRGDLGVAATGWAVGGAEAGYSVPSSTRSWRKR